MKKILFLGLLALGLASAQPAQAWVNAKFSIGLNGSWQSGDNCWFWGLFRNGPTPGPYCGPFQSLPPYAGVLPAYPGPLPTDAPADFQFYSQQAPANSGTALAQQGQPAGPGLSISGQQNLYQPVNFAPPSYGYPTSGSNFPGYYGYTVPPSYWYGR